MKTSEKTYHVHDDGSEADGAVCDKCRADRSWHKRGPYTDLRYIHFEERTGVSVQQFKREMFDQARAEGTEISKA